MKTVEQLLELSKNPYYVLTNAEKAVLDDFLLRQKVDPSTNLANQNGKHSERNTRVRVRNVVEKTVPEPEESGA